MMATKRLKMSKKPPVIIQQLRKLVNPKKATKSSKKDSVCTGKRTVKKTTKRK